MEYIDLMHFISRMLVWLQWSDESRKDFEKNGFSTQANST